MAASKIISKEELPLFLNRIFKNLNLENKAFIKYLHSFYISGKNGTYYYKTFKTIFIDTFKEKYKVTHVTCYKFYWLLRGWSEQQSEDFVRNAFKKDIVFFRNKDIVQYIINNKLWDFNVNNLDFINEFVSLIKIDDHISLNDIQKIYLSKWVHNFFNGPIKGFPKTQVPFYLSRGYSEDEAIEMISQIQKQHSIRSVEYYKKRGYSDEEAIKLVSATQTSFSNQSKSSKAYWLNLGLSEKDAEEKAHFYANLRSVWGKTYWMNKGLNAQEAIEKTHEYNNGCPECKCYNDDIGLYVNTINRYSERQKEAWKLLSKNSARLKQVVPKIGFISHISKAENKCFKYLCENIDSNIKHEPYIVIFPEDFISKNNLYFYACDGYLEIAENRIIIIEYDGGIGVFHQEERDKIRDEEILLIDDNVIGILRIQESALTNSNLLNLKNDVIDALQRIKEGKENIIIIK